MAGKNESTTIYGLEIRAGASKKKLRWRIFASQGAKSGQRALPYRGVPLNKTRCSVISPSQVYSCLCLIGRSLGDIRVLECKGIGVSWASIYSPPCCRHPARRFSLLRTTHRRSNTGDRGCSMYHDAPFAVRGLCVEIPWAASTASRWNVECRNPVIGRDTCYLPFQIATLHNPGG